MENNSNQTPSTSSSYKDYENFTPKEKRDYWLRQVKANHKVITERFKREIKHYLKVYRNQFTDLLPEYMLQGDRVDVNIVYPIVKALIPKLYFKDPQVFITAKQETIVVPQTSLEQDPQTGQVIEQPVIDPNTGIQLTEEYDGVESAMILQTEINHNIKLAKLKQNSKSVIQDAHLCFYGAIKTGFGNDQGVRGMGEDAPVSVREDTDENIAYGIRLKPWDVIPDLNDFYNQEWTAIKYCAHPSRLRRDTRLKNADQIKGTSYTDDKFEERNKELTDGDKIKTEWYEIYVKPCSTYPDGYFYMLSEEVKEDFIYESAWPYEVKENPIKFLYFNPDPEGDLPIPDVRYYVQQQRVKNLHRKIALEYVTRALPFVGCDFAGVKDAAKLKSQLQSGLTPKFVDTTGRDPNTVLRPFSHNNLNADFWRLDGVIDGDVSRMVGMIKGAYPGGGDNIQLASVAKITDEGEEIRQNERADIVMDFLTDILNQWVGYWQEFARPENYTMLEGKKVFTKWTREQIRLKLFLEVKPFSMNYEDPTIVRRQWVDLLNLLGGPAVQQALAQQGAQVDFVKMVKRVLETYHEKDVETFLITGDAKPENQVARALQQGFEIAQTGQVPPLTPTDNHKLFILIYGLFIQIGVPGPFDVAVAQHEQAMLAQSGGVQSPGGGNQENPNSPVGNAANQEAIRQPLQPNPQNGENASSPTTNTR